MTNKICLVYLNRNNAATLEVCKEDTIEEIYLQLRYINFYL